MDFGIFSRFPNRIGLSHSEAFDEHLEMVKVVEELGYDNIWLGEEHFSHDSHYLYLASSALTIGSALAMITTRLRIGMAVVPVPLGHPLRIAEEAAIVDQLSKGRLDFGIGRSGNIQSYKRYGLSYLQSRDRELECAKIIKKAWTTARFDHKGEFFTLMDVCLVPKPYQEPHPPIFMAVTSPDKFAICGSEGYDIFINPRGDRDKLRQGVDAYHKAWQEAGHPGNGKIIARLLCYAADTMEKAHSEPEQGTMALFQHQSRMSSPLEGLSEEANKFRRERSQYLASITYDTVLKGDVTYGTPEFVGETMQKYKDDLGLSGFMMDTNTYGSLPPEKYLHSMRLLSEKVRPHLN